MNNLIKNREFWLANAIIFILFAVTLRSPTFTSLSNLSEIFNDSAILIMLAIGQMMVILTRSIDLSMASNLALSGMIVALINASFPETPVFILLIIATFIGAILGAFNGLLVWKFNIPSIVVTLGTLTIFRGTIFIIAGGKWVNAADLTDGFVNATRYEFLGLTSLSWLAIFAVFFFYAFMNKMPMGRNLYAVGINPQASVYTGIDVGKTTFSAFTIAGALSGLCGFLWVSRYVIGSVEVANGYELTVIAACVIGGVSIAGGIGTVIGTLLGALFLGVINSALPVINISPFWQMAISGVAIILAVILNGRAAKNKGRIILKSSEAHHE